MGFRASFLKHEGFVTCHSESFLHVVDRLAPTVAMNLLLVGVDNGGSIQMWRDAAADGSNIVAISDQPECADLGLGVHVGDVSDRRWLESVLQDMRFDMIIDSTGNADGCVWPWLKPRGVLVIENYDDARVKEIMNAIVMDTKTWLPYEEILGVQYYPHIVIVEKRDPRVVPYLDIIVGEDDPVVSEAVYMGRGGKRIVVSKEALENL